MVRSRSSHGRAGSSSRRTALWVIAAVAAGALVWAATHRASTETADGVTSAGDSVIQQFDASGRTRVQRFTARLLDDTTHDSASGSGRVAVYNVWGSWCGPCRVEAPALARLATETAGAVEFTGINVRDGLDAALAFERTNQVPYPSIRSEDSADALLAFGASLGVTAVPTTVVLDRQGRIAARVVGPTSYATLRALVDDVLAEPGAPRDGPTGATS